MPSGVELRSVAIYPVCPGLGKFSPPYSPVSTPMPSMPERLAASRSQTASADDETVPGGNPETLPAR